MQFKQKNFNKIPKKLALKLSQIKNNRIIIGSDVTISKNDMNNYPYDKLTNEGKLQLGEKIEFTPETTMGRYSKRNLLGKTIPLKNIDKIEKTWAIEGPNFGDYSKGTHTAIITKQVWQTKTEFPKNLSITMIPVDISDDQVTIRTEISIPLSRNSEFFNEDLLFFINLLNENVHDVDILSIDEEENARLNQKTQNVDWELLPVGSKDVPALLKARLGNTPHNNTRTDERIDFFSNSNLPIDHYITGKGSFERYFGMAFDNGVVVLEDFNYGNATYVFHDNWENFSQMSRLDLIHLNSTEIERIVHNRNWKTRLKYIVTASTRS